MEEVDPTPELGEITGSVAYELGETFKDATVESWDFLGEVEIKFPDGKKYRIEIVEADGSEE